MHDAGAGGVAHGPHVANRVPPPTVEPSAACTTTGSLSGSTGLVNHEIM